MSEEDDFPESAKERKAQRKRAIRRDRSQYKKTDLEKQKRKSALQASQKLAKKEVLHGRVLAISPEEIKVESAHQIYSCVLRGALKQKVSRDKNLVTVGDFVLFEAEEELRGAISHIEPRHSILSRQEHLRRKTRQLIAANIDQVLITVSVVQPPLKPSLVDRYLISTYKGKMEPVIVVNKIDLLVPGSEEAELFELLRSTYQALKIPLIALSAETGEGMELLKEQMKGRASVFSGQSGVGKSSLINTLAGLTLPIGPLVEKTKKGTHTTSSARLLPLPFGGWCIDTPGIRSFGIWDLQREDLKTYFPEIAALGTGCKYPNCTHTHEPECALEKAVEEGLLSPLRYLSYLKLTSELST